MTISNEKEGGVADSYSRLETLFGWARVTLLTGILLGLSACSSGIRSQSPVVTAAQPVTSADGTQTPKPVNTITPTSTRLPTDPPTPTFTAYPFMLTGMVEPTLQGFKYHPYDPSRWELIPGSEGLFLSTVYLDPENTLWTIHKNNLLSYDGNTWESIPLVHTDYEDYFPDDMDPDGTLWISAYADGISGIVRVKDRQVTFIKLPEMHRRWAFVASDRHQGIWALYETSGSKTVRLFHYLNETWNEIPLPVDLDSYSYVLSDSRGDPWIYDNTKILHLKGSSWRVYKAEDYWRIRTGEGPTRLIFAPGQNGSMWITVTQQPYIFRFYPDGTNTRYSQPFLEKYDGMGMLMHVDRQNRLWFTHMCCGPSFGPVAYWDGLYGHAFTGLPFEQARTVLSQGDRVLIQTEAGWYWYMPEK